MQAKKPAPRPKQVPKSKGLLDPSTLPKGLERLERALAHMGLASRREAKALIVAGKIRVNGKVVKEPGFGIKVGVDEIDTGKKLAETKESFLVYKARGIETSRTAPGNRDLKNQYPKLAHLAPIGRLDKDSEGLIIMSNDGTLTKALTGVDSHIGKEYTVSVRENITNDALEKMRTGIVIDKIPTKPAEVKRISRSVFAITLFEGRKHQIRRMCDACHLTIESLVRTKIGHLKIGPMEAGSMNQIAQKDIDLLKA